MPERREFLKWRACHSETCPSREALQEMLGKRALVIGAAP